MATRKFYDSPWFYGIGVAVLLLAAAASMVQYRPTIEVETGSAEDLLTLRDRDDLNVVFIVIDMLRADRLTSYGYERNTSPVMTELAQRAIRFASVESQSSWTKASMASMWLGQYPERTGIQRYMHGLSDDVRMPAEILRDEGFKTGGVWRNGWVAHNFGFGQGFDLYVRPTAVKRPGMMRGNPSVNKLMGTDYDATEFAVGYLESYQHDRFFLYIHYMDVHQYIYADTSPPFGSQYSDFYDGSIHWVDRNIGFILQALRDRNLLHKTLIVIASDHGEGFFEHGEEGHARTLFREVQSVPLFIIPPFEIEGGIVVEENVANIDIWPTILDLVGAPPLENAQGRSLVPLILAAADEAAASPEAQELSERPVFSQLDRSWGHVDYESKPLVAIVDGQFRLVLDPQNDAVSYLYDHAEDPLERVNLVKKRPEVFEELKGKVESFLAGEGAPTVEPDEVELTEMALHQLRALGYVLERPPTMGAEEAKEGSEKAGSEEGEETSAEDAQEPPADAESAAP